MLSNVTSTGQLAGHDQGLAALRKTAGKLANAGVLWGAVAVLGGWLFRRPWEAMLAGTTGLLTALVVHYGTADLTGLMPWTTWSSNQGWFIAAVVMGPPLGLIGALSRRLDLWGLLARIALPAGAVIEPFFNGWFPPMTLDTWANRVSGVAAGCVMIVGAAIWATLVVVRWQTKRQIDGATELNQHETGALTSTRKGATPT